MMKNLYSILLSVIFVLSFSTVNAERMTRPVIVRVGQNSAPNILDAQLIDSITFSCYTVDSVLCPSPQTQMIWCSDTVFCTPLSDLVEVQFEVPENRIREDVNIISLTDDMMKYIHRAEVCNIEHPQSGSNFLVNNPYIDFSSSLPKEFIPEKGDIVIYEGSNELFPCGFIGRCTDSPGKDVDYNFRATFEYIDLSDVYETFFDAYHYAPEEGGEIQVEEDEVSTHDVKKNNIFERTERDLWLPWYRMDLRRFFNSSFTAWKSRPFEISTSSTGEIGLRGGLHFYTSTLIENGVSYSNYSIQIQQELRLETNTSFEGKIDKSIPMPGDIKTRVPLAPFIVAGANWNFNIELNGQFDISTTSDVVASLGLRASSRSDELDADGNPIWHLEPTGRLLSPQNDMSAVGSGHIKLTFSVDPYIAALHKSLASISAKLYSGVRFDFNSEISLDKWQNSSKDPSVYFALSNDIAMEGSWTKGINGIVTILQRDWSHDLVENTSNFMRKPLIPSIESIEADWKSATTLKISSDIHQSEVKHSALFDPRQCGFLIYELDNSNNIMTDSQSQQLSFRSQQEPMTFSETIAELDRSRRYRVAPAFTFDFAPDHIILADPCDDVEYFDPPESSGKFIDWYCAHKYVNGQPLESEYEAHVVYDIPLPEFNFRNMVDEKNDEWGVFIINANKTDSIYDSATFKNIPFDQATGRQLAAWAEEKLGWYGNVVTETDIKMPMLPLRQLNMLSVPYRSYRSIFTNDYIWPEISSNGSHVIYYSTVVAGYYVRNSKDISVLYVESVPLNFVEKVSVELKNPEIRVVSNNYGEYALAEFDVDIEGIFGIFTSVYRFYSLLFHNYCDKNTYSFTNDLRLENYGTNGWRFCRFDPNGDKIDGPYFDSLWRNLGYCRTLPFFKDYFCYDTPNWSSDKWAAFKFKNRIHYMGEFDGVGSEEIVKGYKIMTTVLKPESLLTRDFTLCKNHMYMQLSWASHLRASIQKRSNGYPVISKNHNPNWDYIYMYK